MRFEVLFAAAGLCWAGCASSPCGIDGLNTDQCDLVEAFAMPTALPPARGNAVGDHPDAAQLGFQIFYDARFSFTQEVRCATCHMPEQEFGDGRALPLFGPQPPRNTPSVLNSARARWHFWDGRADSLWSQPLFAFENPAEMDFTRLEVAHRIRSSYRQAYEGLFGPLPDLANADRFPPRGKPGDAAFDGMSQVDRDAVNRIAANVGKALESYTRKLAAGPSRLDAFLAGDRAALDPTERLGLAVFVRSGCAGCHAGPTLTDERFHNLGVGAWPEQPIDLGRAGGLAILKQSPFNGAGPYFDGPASDDEMPGEEEASIGAFRTPSLRNLGRSAPYGHNGRFASVAEVVDFHLAGGGVDAERFAGAVDPALRPVRLSQSERDALLAFLGALDGTYPPPPWNNWPDK